jgi:formylglycine-generating enzyme required for sulfatase activity
VALVIGNDRYLHFSELQQAVGDATRVGATLAGLPQPFALTQHRDLGRRELRRAVEAFGQQLGTRGGEVALVYFAGHAVTHDGDVWLLPVDAQIEQPEDVKSEGLPLQEVLSAVRRPGWKAVAVVLDACRNELFAGRTAPAGIRGDALARGLLMPANVGDGVIVAFATAAGQVAKEDAQGGYYTREWLKQLATPGLRLLDVFNDTALAVQRKTGQKPELRLVSAVEPIYLAGLGTRPVAPAPSPLPSPAPAPSPAPSPAVPAKSADGLLLVRRGDRLPEVGVAFRHALRSGGEGPVMVVVPGGSYLMGSPDTEADRDSDEGPQRRVMVSAFGAGKYEVTVSEFRRFVDATGHRTDAEADVDVPDDLAEAYKGPNPGCWVFQQSGPWAWEAGRSWKSPGLSGTGERHPVVCVSWNDAQAYVRWLAEETGAGYRLPSESEQEWLLRGGREGERFGWGSEVSEACRYGNVAGLEGAPNDRSWTLKADCNDGSRGLSPVGWYASQAFGLHDVLGNALEWSADCYGAYAGARTDGGAVAQANCRARVLRGASWDAQPAGLRSALRVRSAPANRNNNTGFRLALDR